MSQHACGGVFYLSIVYARALCPLSHLAGLEPSFLMETLALFAAT